MTADARGGAAIVAALVAAAAVPACKSAPQRRMEAQEPVESIDQAEIALQDNERRLAELGIVPPSQPEDAGGGLGYTEEEESVAGESVPATARPELSNASGDTRRDGFGATGSTAVPRCTRICDIAESTCALAQQVCDLVARHPDKPRYGKACARAEQQCDAASEACETCE